MYFAPSSGVDALADRVAGIGAEAEFHGGHAGDFGPPRPPQRQLSTAEEAEIRTILEPILTVERGLS